MKIVFMGTPEFAVPYLEYLYKENFDVAMVITQPDRPKGRGKKLQSPPIKELADKFLIPVFQPVNINSNESLDTLRDIKPDIYILLLLVRYYQKRFWIYLLSAVLMYMHRSYRNTGERHRFSGHF
jgi:methionyl-tRNA formyltransferase